MTFVDCPYPCDKQADVVDRYVLESSDGPVEHIQTYCLDGHFFNGPVAMLRGVDKDRPSA